MEILSCGLFRVFYSEKIHNRKLYAGIITTSCKDGTFGIIASNIHVTTGKEICRDVEIIAKPEKVLNCHGVRTVFPFRDGSLINAKKSSELTLTDSTLLAKSADISTYPF